MDICEMKYWYEIELESFVNYIILLIDLALQ